MRYVLGLGTNLGDREAALEQAVESLERIPHTKVTALSSLYETAAVGYTDQPDFLNMVVVVESNVSPRAMLGACLGIEAALGRVRTFQNAPRVIDIDVLLAENYEETTPELTVPHPRMWERAFVLCPLLELKEAGALAEFSLPQVISVPKDQQISKISKKYKKGY